MALEDAQGDRRACPVRREVRRGGARRLHGRRRVGRAAATKANKAWSVELCGGTHVTRTGDIGLVKLTGESASAAGVRRIEALTADGAREHLAQQDARMRELAAALRTKPDDVVERVKALLEERKQLERELAERQAPAGARRRRGRQRRGRRGRGGRAHRRQDQADGARGAGPQPQGPARTGRRRQEAGRLRHRRHRRRHRGRQGRPRGRRHRRTSPAPTAPSISSRSAPRRSAARAAAAGPTWPRPAAPTAPRPRPRSRRSRPSSPADRESWIRRVT